MAITGEGLNISGLRAVDMQVRSMVILLMFGTDWLLLSSHRKRSMIIRVVLLLPSGYVTGGETSVPDHNDQGEYDMADRRHAVRPLGCKATRYHGAITQYIVITVRRHHQFGI